MKFGHVVAEIIASKCLIMGNKYLVRQNCKQWLRVCEWF